MIKADDTFDGTWPFTPHFSSVSGFRQHYVDEGAADAPVIICLHGEPTWGYLYRNFIPRLAETHRVIVPDHMGFGKSETPQDRDYTLKTHVDNLMGLIDELDLHDITFVGQDWGGPITAAYALRHADRVKRMIYMNTIIGFGRVPAPENKTRWFQWIEDHHEAGTLEGILGEMGSSVLSIMKFLGFQNSAAVDETWIRAYSAPFPDRASCIGAINFPLDIHLGTFIPYVIDGFKTGDMAAFRKIPAMMATGTEDYAIDPDHAIADFQAIFPDAPVVRLPGVGHFCQEDAPDILVPLIQQFIQMT